MEVADSGGGDAHRESDISWRRMLAVFWRIGILSFGGPAAQIAVMHRILVEEEKWLDEPRFLGALSFCMLLPGPEAMQLATYAGWQLRGVRGGLLAGLLFVVPGALVVLGLAMLYMAVGHLPVMAALFLGIKGAVLIIVMEALLRVAKRALHSAVHWVIAGLAFVAIFFLSAPFPLIILVTALAGFFLLGGQSIENTGTGRGGGSVSGTVRTVAIWMVIWWTPVLLMMALGGYDILVQIGNFFSRLAVVTFGGAYAVLAYLAQDVVTHKGWLSAGEMMDGLGLAETTPGPLILVTEFVGYVAGYRAGGVGMGIAGALVTLWVTFAPCFLWIFAGAPYIEQLTAQPRLKGALEVDHGGGGGRDSSTFPSGSACTSCSPNCRSVQIGPLKLLAPVWHTLDWRVLLIGIVSAIMLLWRHQSLMRTLGVAALMGIGFAAIDHFAG